MGQIDNLAKGNLDDIFRRLRALEFSTNQLSMAIGSGGITVHDGGSITIENGGLYVTGTATISGTLDVTGTTNFTGPTNVSGAFTVTGPTKLDGVTDVGGAFTVTGLTELKGDTTVSGTLDVTGAMATKGTLSVEGVTTLENDLNLTSGGKITAGAVSIDPSHLSGSVRFSNGTALAATPNGVQITSADESGAVVVGNGQASVSVTGGGEFIATAAGALIYGDLQTSDAVIIQNLPETLNKANLWASASGRLYRSTAA